MLGLATGVAVSAMHWFGPIDIPDPVVQIGGIATTATSLYPAAFGAVGLVVGVFIGAMRGKNL
jgi:hypothetical protein